MVDYKLFSADSHVTEPADLWVERIDRQFSFRAPRVVPLEKDGRVQDFMIYEGYPPHPVEPGIGAAGRERGGGNGEFKARSYHEALPGGWNPAVRLDDQDTDGVDGEIIHPTLGFRMFWLKDAALQRACFRVYNDWLAEMCSYAPSRLFGVPLISLYDIDLACEELRRVNKLGLKGAMIWQQPPADFKPYSDPYYDPFWATAQDLDAPIALHGITGHGESRYSIAYWNPESILGNVTRHHEIERTLALLILSGVLERFPRLKVISVENHTDWLPVWMNRLDGSIRRAPATFPTKLTMTPLEYFHRQVYVTYINETDAVGKRELIGLDNLMWSSDYPHSASTWPKSQDIVARDFDGLPEEHRRKIVRANALRLFDLASVAA